DVLHSHLETAAHVIHFLVATNAGAFGLVLGLGQPRFKLFFFRAQRRQFRGRFLVAGPALLGGGELSLQLLSRFLPGALLGLQPVSLGFQFGLLPLGLIERGLVLADFVLARVELRLQFRQLLSGVVSLGLAGVNFLAQTVIFALQLRQP